LEGLAEWSWNVRLRKVRTPRNRRCYVDVTISALTPEISGRAAIRWIEWLEPGERQGVATDFKMDSALAFMAVAGAD
jgi:hypothetical protein